MRRGLGGLGRFLGLVLLLVLIAPVVALGPAMVVDHGWNGLTRVSALPPALVILDPLVWRCVRNSLTVAVVVTVGSVAIGTGLGLILGRRRFWGRWPLGLLSVVPLAISPIWVAPGVVAWIGGESGWDWLAARSFLGQPGDEWGRWLALVWVEVASLAPLAILATRRGLNRIDPTWADAARVVGAGRLRVWLDVTWPTVRPGLARVAGWIFTLTLVEPAGPILLDLRRTLVVEMADAALRFAEPNRAATLAAIAVALSALGQSVCLRWGGPDFSTLANSTRSPTPPRAGTRLGGLAVASLIVWVGLTLGPVVNFARRLATTTLDGRSFDLATLRSILRSWAAPEVTTWALNSVLTATLAVGLARLVLALLGGRDRLWWVRPFATVPSLVVGVGSLAIPSLLAAWANATQQPMLVASLNAVGIELSPGRFPGVLLILALAAAVLPILAGGIGRPGGDQSPALIDAAILMGGTERAARRSVRRTGGRGLWGITLFAWSWASTDLATAWLLTTLPERRTLAPAALELIGHGSDPLDPRLLGIGLVTLGVRLIGLGCLLTAIRGHRRGAEPIRLVADSRATIN